MLHHTDLGDGLRLIVPAGVSPSVLLDPFVPGLEFGGQAVTMVGMVDEEPLFVAEGQPSELDVLLLAEELGPGATKGEQSDLTLPFRATSQISIGDPVVAVLKPTSATASQVWPQLADYEFHQVELACSFAAAAGCRFTDARFSVVLHTGWNDGAQRPGEAIAYDLFPVLLEDAQTVTVTSTIKPEVSFGYEPVSATLSLPSREKVSEQVRYSGRVAAFDLRGAHPGWTFYRTEQHEINGPQRLFMLVRKPRGSSVRATFALDARVQFVLGGRGFSPVELVMVFRDRHRAGTVSEASVALC